VSQSFPEVKENILKNIQRFIETEILYRQSVDLHLKKLLEQKGNEVHIPVLKLLKTIPLATIVYEIIKDFGFTAHQTDEVIGLLKSETGKYVESASHRIIKNRNWLIIAPVVITEAQHILIENTDKRIVFAGGEIAIEKIATDKVNLNSSPSIAMLDAGEISFPLLLRKWKQGDYFYPLGMQKKKKVNRFLTDQKLSLTQKENTWVIEMNKKIIWVAGLRIDDRFKTTPQTRQVLKLEFNK
jgi:tRNA(Ile)-lysidine synthase